MMERRFLVAAEDLCRRTGRRPRDAFMRRAASTAYYALFHALCRMCADELIGGSNAKTQAWGRTYRAVDHRAAKAALQGRDALAIDPTLPTLGLLFAQLQERRHQADYDPAPFEHTFDDTLALVNQARTAIDMLNALQPEKRRTLATLILFKPRSGGA